MIDLTEREYHDALDAAHSEGYNEGWRDGEQVGYYQGCEHGYDQAMSEKAADIGG